VVYSITGQVYTMGQCLKVYICGLQYYRTGLHYGTMFECVYLWFTVLQDRFTLWDKVKRCIFAVYNITGQVYTMGQCLNVYICGLQYNRTCLHYGTKFKGVYLWFTVLQDRFTLWDKV